MVAATWMWACGDKDYSSLETVFQDTAVEGDSLSAAPGDSLEDSVGVNGVKDSLPLREYTLAGVVAHPYCDGNGPIWVDVYDSNMARLGRFKDSLRVEETDTTLYRMPFQVTFSSVPFRYASVLAKDCFDLAAFVDVGSDSLKDSISLNMLSTMARGREMALLRQGGVYEDVVKQVEEELLQSFMIDSMLEIRELKDISIWNALGVLMHGDDYESYRIWGWKDMVQHFEDDFVMDGVIDNAPCSYLAAMTQEELKYYTSKYVRRTPDYDKTEYEETYYIVHYLWETCGDMPHCSDSLDGWYRQYLKYAYSGDNSLVFICHDGLWVREDVEPREDGEMEMGDKTSPEDNAENWLE